MPQRSGIAVTDAQGKVIAAPAGPLWVIAGPGSGKTEVMVLRCLRLLFVDGVEPAAIMLTTFTEKAAREIQDRLAVYAAWISENGELIEPPDVTRVRSGTLHSLCNDIMLEYRFPAYQNVRLMDELEQLIFINEHAELARRTPGPSEQQLWSEFVGLLGGFPNMSAQTRMRSRLSRAVATRELVNRIAEYRVDLARLRAAPVWGQCLADGYADYREKLRTLQRSDYSHVQVSFLQFLDEPKGLLFRQGDGSADHPGIQHVLVDEYQDTNPIQEAIYLKLAAEEPHNLCVVGDDDQAIYRFRGGTVESLINFNQACAQAWGLDPTALEPLPLYENFRSHTRIVDWCNHYIQAPPLMQAEGARAPGKQPLVARARLNGQLGDYSAVNIATGPQVRDVARVFALIVRELLDSGTISDPRACALLLPSTRETAPWAGHYRRELEAVDISCYNPRAKTFIEQEEVQVALGALLTVLDPGSAAVPRIGNVRTIAAAWATAYMGIQATSPELAGYVRTAQGQIAIKRSMDIFRTNAMELFYILLSFPPFTTWQRDPERNLRLSKLTRILEAYTSMPRPAEPQRTRNVLAASQAGRQVSRTWISSLYWGLVAILQQQGLDDEEDEYESFPAGRLPFLTIYQAKGLEFPFVFVATKDRYEPQPSGAHEAEDLLYPFRENPPPPRFTAAQRAVQDAARLFYVAHSRAQHALVILTTHAQRDRGCIHIGVGGGAWIEQYGGQDLTLLGASP